MRLSRLPLLIFVTIMSLLFTSCKSNSSSALKEYEKDTYLGQDICDLMKEEALEKGKLNKSNVKDEYKDIYSREKRIFAILIPKAENCVASTTTDPSLGLSDNDDSPDTNGSPAVSGANISCRSITAERLADYQTKSKQLARCTQLEDTDIPSELKSSDSIVCDTIDDSGLFDGKCDFSRDKLLKLGVKGIGKGCDLVGTFLKNRKLGKYDSAASNECSGVIVKEICAKYGVFGIEGLKIVDDNISTQEEKTVDLVKTVGSATVRSFVNSISKCMIAYGKESVKEQLKEGITEGITKSAFKASIDKMNSNLTEFKKSSAGKRIAALACSVGTDVAANMIESQTPAEHSDGCADFITNWDANRGAACLRTAKDGCNIYAANIDLNDIAGFGDEQLVEKALLEITSSGISAACSAGGPVSGIACGAISKSTGYIKDALLEGKSNPWADCLGTPAIGRCVGRQYFEWTTGIAKSELESPNSQFEKAAGDEKYETTFCACIESCYADKTWPRSNKLFHSERSYSMISTSGLCAAREKTLDDSQFNITYDGSPVFRQVTDCQLVKARSKYKHFADPDLDSQKTLNIEVNRNGTWKTEVYRGGDAVYCGGKT